MKHKHELQLGATVPCYLYTLANRLFAKQNTDLKALRLPSLIPIEIIQHTSALGLSILFSSHLCSLLPLEEGGGHRQTKRRQDGSSFQDLTAFSKDSKKQRKTQQRPLVVRALWANGQPKQPCWKLPQTLHPASQEPCPRRNFCWSPQWVSFRTDMWATDAHMATDDAQSKTKIASFRPPHNSTTMGALKWLSQKGTKKNYW